MDLDEYDYLEKAVEGKHGAAPMDEKRSSRGYRHRDVDHGGDDDKIENRRERREDRDKEWDRERSSSRKERKERERERDHRHRDRERDSYRDWEIERSRRHAREEEMDVERERSRRSSSRSKRHERDPEMEYERERSKSESRLKRHDREMEMEMEMERARSKERALRERDAEREIRESRKPKERKEAVEPEADPERDHRTIFAYQMPLRATERDVYEFFSQAGKVRDVRLIMDRNLRRSKGVGYIEFYDVKSVQEALQLAGKHLLGQPVMVKRSEAEKNHVQSTAGGTGISAPGADRKLYVGNLHFNMTEDHLRQIFEAFGPVELVQLPLDMETGYCRGFGFVQFSQLEHAKVAQQSLNGTLEIAGRIVKVSSVTEHVTQDPGTGATDFDDDDDGGGLALNARSRAILMQKLDRTGTATSIAESVGAPLLNGSNTTRHAVSASNGFAARSTLAPAPAVESIGDPSDCILLKNMFDPSTETELDFDLDIKEDVQDECSKFGRLRHIFVDKNSGGHVYLRFESVAAAASCQRSMHMRWFARRCISAVFLRPQEYEAKVMAVVP